MKTILPAVRNPMNELAMALRAYYGDRLRKIVLYGSMARGDGVLPDADIDVLVVLTGAVSPLEETWRHSALTAEISLKHDVLLSLSFISQDEYDQAGSPLLLNVIREGVAM